MASHEMTLKNYQQQLKDSTKKIYENFTEILKTKTEHVDFEVQVKAAEIVRSYQSLMQLVSEIRSFLIINDLIDINHKAPTSVDVSLTSNHQNQTILKQSEDKLKRLRDDIAMFLFELEMPIP